MKGVIAPSRRRSGTPDTLRKCREESRRRRSGPAGHRRARLRTGRPRPCRDASRPGSSSPIGRDTRRNVIPVIGFRCRATRPRRGERGGSTSVPTPACRLRRRPAWRRAGTRAASPASSCGFRCARANLVDPRRCGRPRSRCPIRYSLWRVALCSRPCARRVSPSSIATRSTVSPVAMSCFHARLSRPSRRMVLACGGALCGGGNARRLSSSVRGGRTGRSSAPAPAKRVSVTGSGDGQAIGQ
jgi:hypothetical protein